MPIFCRQNTECFCKLRKLQATCWPTSKQKAFPACRGIGALPRRTCVVAAARSIIVLAPCCALRVISRFTIARAAPPCNCLGAGPQSLPLCVGDSRTSVRPRLDDSVNLPTRTTPRTLATALSRRGKQANLNHCAPLFRLHRQLISNNVKMAPDAERLVKTAPRQVPATVVAPVPATVVAPRMCQMPSTCLVKPFVGGASSVA